MVTAPKRTKVPGWQVSGHEAAAAAHRRPAQGCWAAGSTLLTVLINICCGKLSACLPVCHALWQWCTHRPCYITVLPCAHRITKDVGVWQIIGGHIQTHTLSAISIIRLQNDVVPLHLYVMSHPSFPLPVCLSLYLSLCQSLWICLSEFITQLREETVYVFYLCFSLFYCHQGFLLPSVSPLCVAQTGCFLINTKSARLHRVAYFNFRPHAQDENIIK